VEGAVWPRRRHRPHGCSVSSSCIRVPHERAKRRTQKGARPDHAQAVAASLPLLRGLCGRLLVATVGVMQVRRLPRGGGAIWPRRRRSRCAGAPLYWELDTRKAGVDGLIGRAIYKQFTTVVHLKQQVRVTVTDSVWQDVLQHVRDMVAADATTSTSCGLCH